MSAEFQENDLGTSAHYQAKILFQGRCCLPKCSDNLDLKPSSTPKLKNLPQHHHSSHVSLILAQPNKTLPENQRQHMTYTHRKIMLDQCRSKERKNLKTKHFLHTEKSPRSVGTEQDVVLDQVDELGCGEELAQGIDFDLVDDEQDKSEEELMDHHSDSRGRRETNESEIAQQIQGDKDVWEWTKKSVFKLCKRSNTAQMASNGVSAQLAEMLTDRLFSDNSCTDKMFLEGFYANGWFPHDIFSNEEDEMCLDICDAGEALADKDGLSECELFDHTDPLLIETAKIEKDIVAVSMEEGSESSYLTSSSIEEDDDEVQQELKKMEELGNNSSDKSLDTDHLSVSSASSQKSETVLDENDLFKATQICCNKGVLEEKDHQIEQTTLSLSSDSLLQYPAVSCNQTLIQNQTEDSTAQDEEVHKNRETMKSDQLTITVEDLYEETEPIIQAKDFLQNRKYLMTRSISVETPRNNLDPTISPATGTGRLLLHPRSFYTDHCFIGDCRPALTGSLGCLSQGFHNSTNLDNMSKVDIPPPFELASITKRPIRKSSPSLSSEISATCKKPDFGLKRYLLPLRFLRKSDRKSLVDNRSISSRSSSESSPQGSCKRLDFIRHNMGSPELQRTPECTPSMSPSSFLFHKNRQKVGPNLTLHKDLACSTISIEPDNMFHSLFEPVPLSKPRSFSSPNADSSDYENVTNTSSHYENVQIRLLNPVIQSQRNQGSSSDTDGYVDMSSLPGFQGKSPSSEQETDSTYTFCSPNVRPDGTVGVVCTQEKKTKTLDRMTITCSRAFYNAKELLDSEAWHVKTLQLLSETFKADERLLKVWTEIPDIYSLHQNIHTLLETHMKEWHQNEGLAEIILAKKSEFSVFSSYISHYDEKLNYLEHIKSTLSDTLSLKKRLLLVIVRILQYRMLLTDYLNNISPDSKQFQDTQDALVVVSDIAYQVNDSLKNGADLLRLVSIEHSVLGLTDLIQPERVFVKEGTLMKVSRKCKQPRHLFLMNDLLLYTYPQQDGKYRLINTLPLAGMEVTKPPVEHAQNALKIAVKDISITLSAGSCVERDGWFVTLNRTLVDLGPASGHCLELMEGPEMCLGENAPPLMSVSQVTACMNCPSHFSLTNRRHHCHACGKVVCKDCCRNKFPLKYMKNRRAKVCDYCYTELCKNDVVTVVEGNNRPLSAMFQNIHPSSLWRSRKGHMSFNQETGAECVMSGTLQRCRNSKRSWRSLWFLLKDKVLYTYPQPEERLACETLPLLGFSVRSEIEGESSVFQLYHKSTLFYTFRAQDSHTAQRWVNAMEEATVL